MIGYNIKHGGLTMTKNFEIVYAEIIHCFGKEYFEYRDESG